MNFYSAPTPGGIGLSDFVRPSQQPSQLPRPQQPGTQPAGSQTPATQGSSDTSGSSTTDSQSDSSTTSEGGAPGSFWRIPIKLSSALRQGYDSNVFTSETDPVASPYTNLALGAEYKFGGSRLQLAAQASIGATYYYSRPGNKIDYNGGISFTADYAASSRLLISIANNSQFVPQPQLGVVGGGITNVDQGYFYQSTSIAVVYQINRRLASVTNYNLSAFYYPNQALNSYQGRIDQSLSESLQLLVLPKTSLSLIYRVNPVTYFGEDLDSFGQFVLLGINQSFNPRFSFNAQFGAEQRDNQNPVDGPSTSRNPFFESNLTYAYGPASRLVFNARYGTEASGLANVTQTTVLRFGLGIAHSLTRRISLSLDVNYQNRYYDQPQVIPDYSENVYQVNLGARFQVNRFLSVEAGYSYSQVTSPQPEQSQEYTRQIIFIGCAIAI